MVGAGIAANFRGSRYPVVVAILVISGCGGSDSSQPPAEVSLVASTAADIPEAADQTVIVTVKAEPTPPRSLLVPLEYSGTATRDYDYTASADVVVIPANTASVDVEIDVYRDFDAEENETISIRLGEVQGNGERSATAQVQLNILDGGPCRRRQDAGYTRARRPGRRIVSPATSSSRKVRSSSGRLSRVHLLKLHHPAV